MGNSISSRGSFKLFAAGLCVVVLVVWALGDWGQPFESSPLDKVADADISCDNLGGSLERDVCYWDRVIEEWQWHGFTRIDYCNHMENSHMQYVCLRLSTRPHMMQFVSKSNASATFLEISEAVKGCRMQVNPLKWFCILRTVASLASSNLSETERICNSLGDAHLMGECKFYTAVARIRTLESRNIDEERASLMDFCNTLIDRDWRAECYFLLADEFALLRPVAHLDEIVEACRRSNEAADYGCYYHAVMLLPPGEASAYCDLMDDDNLKSQCAWGVGRTIASLSEGNITKGMEECQEFFPLRTEDCLSGLAHFTGNSYTPNISHISVVCRGFPIELVESCVLGAITTHALPPYKNDISYAIEKCNEFPSEFQGFCFDVVIDDILKLLPQKSSEAIAWCGKLPRRFEEKCFKKLHREDDKEY